jgi:hypothetical protein
MIAGIYKSFLLPPNLLLRQINSVSQTILDKKADTSRAQLRSSSKHALTILINTLIAYEMFLV